MKHRWRETPDLTQCRQCGAVRQTKTRSVPIEYGTDEEGFTYVKDTPSGPRIVEVVLNGKAVSLTKCPGKKP